MRGTRDTWVDLDRSRSARPAPTIAAVLRRVPFVTLCAALLAVPIACARSRPPADEGASRDAPAPTLPRFDEVLDGAALAFAECRGSDAPADETTTVGLRIAIDARGHVTEIVRDDDAASPVADCVADVAAHLRFEPPSAAARVHLEISLPPPGASALVRFRQLAIQRIGPAPAATTDVDPARDLATAPSATASASASIAGPIVPGADQVVAKNKWRFRICYAKALKEDFDAGGTVTVTVTIDAEGRVTAADASASKDVRPRGLATCVAGTFYSMRFSPPDGGTATFKVNAVFATKKSGR